MPTSPHSQISLQQQYHRLCRDWDHYKISIPHRRHRRSRSTSDLLSSDDAELDAELISSPRRTARLERRLIEALEEEAGAVEIEPPLHLSSSAWNEYDDEGLSSSDNDDFGDKKGWMEKLRRFGIAVGAAAVCVLAFGVLFVVEEAGQLMAPT